MTRFLIRYRVYDLGHSLTPSMPTKRLTHLYLLLILVLCVYFILRGELLINGSWDDATRLSLFMSDSSALPFFDDLSKLSPEYQNQTCAAGFEYKRNYILRNSYLFPSSRAAKPRIPRLIHQTAKSRCLVQRVWKATERWRDKGFEQFSYYFHDDDSMKRLFEQEFQNFPKLEAIYKHCMKTGTIQADVWRYLVLYVYGGIYADIDSAPADLRPEHLLGVDALFVVEQYHILSQWFMAASPRHPLMRLALEQALDNMYKQPDVGKIGAAAVTGPHALHEGLRQFANEPITRIAIGTKPVRAGVYTGIDQRIITVLGKAEFQNEYVNRDVLRGKPRLYQKMGMMHFSQERNATGISCRRAIDRGIRVYG